MGMFQALIDALRTPDLRNKILFTLGMIRRVAHLIVVTDEKDASR